jgi:hypothetical protein
MCCKKKKGVTRRTRSYAAILPEISWAHVFPLHAAAALVDSVLRGGMGQQASTPSGATHMTLPLNNRLLLLLLLPLLRLPQR